jgi:hypothetical protein
MFFTIVQGIKRIHERLSWLPCGMLMAHAGVHYIRER